jgi:ABC-type uncharacterized transport system involved in gliding motility auxiliary subunit
MDRFGERLKSIDRRLLTIGGILAAVVFFLSLNVLVDTGFTNARLDLTADSRFTLSDGTRETLAALKEPVSLRFYRSKQLDLLGPAYTSHADRVSDLLEEYVRLAGGKLKVERYDPQPFSPEEDLAVADGLRGILVSDDGTQVYFGLSGRNTTDDTQSIPLLSPERAPFLEYDLTRLVYDLSHPDKPVVAVVGDLPINGSQFNQFQPWAVLGSMRQFFTVRHLSPSPTKIDDDVGILVLTQPQSLNEQGLYAIDQFVMRGGRILAFVDPLTEAMPPQNPQMPPQPDHAIEALAPLLKAWGVEIPSGKVVGDRATAARVQAVNQGRQVITDYLPWISLPPALMASDDVVTGNLQVLNLRSAGHIRAIEGATTKLEPLFTSSDQAMEIDADKLRIRPNPVALLADFKASGERYILGARVTGPVKSAFPDGPPESVKDEKIRAAYKAEADAPLNMILIADADLLADRNWVQMGNLLGQRFQVPTANNGDLVVNALDNLSGGEGLIGLRGRGLERRPFQVLDAMHRDAEAQFRAKEQTLRQKIQETQDKIRKLQKEEGESGVLLTAEQQQAIDDFRTEMLGLRQELRGVQHSLRQNVDALETRIRLINIGAVPLLVALAAIVLALWRRRRAARFQAGLAH